ncbi:MAG TPA: type II secretion system protein N [Burkholderiales bacterium]
MIAAPRRPGVQLAILGVGAYLVFLVANLPAAWLGFALERSSGGMLALGEAGGTVWSGRGVLALRSGGAYGRIAEIEWHCNPLWILTGRMNVALSGRAPGTQLRANASLVLGSVRLKDVEFSAPAAFLETAMAVVAFARPDGQLSIKADSIEAGKESVRGTASVEWTDAGLSGLSAGRLGDYKLQITGNGDRAELKLATLRGDLRLDAQGEWRASQPHVLQMRGTAATAPERKDLESLMQLMGIRGSGASRPFVWTVPI